MSTYRYQLITTADGRTIPVKSTSNVEYAAAGSTIQNLPDMTDEQFAALQQAASMGPVTTETINAILQS